MKRLFRSAKIIALLAALTLGGAANATSASASPEKHHVRILIQKIDVISDGDPGVSSGCGEVKANIVVHDEVNDSWWGYADIRNDKPVQTINGIKVQSWCEGVQGLAPLDLENQINKADIVAQPGQPLALTGWVFEYDGPGESTGTLPHVNFVVPQPGHFGTYLLKAHNGNQHGTITFNFTVKIGTL